MDITQLPIMLTMTQDEYWEKIRELLRKELLALQEKSKPKVAYEVPGMTQKPLYKAAEVVELFQISRQTLHNWIKEGILKPYKIKSRSFFLWSDLEKLITPEGK